MRSLFYFLALAVLLGCEAKAQTAAPPSSNTAAHARLGGPELYKTKTPVEGEQAPTWTNFPEDVIQQGCSQFSRCRAYTVFSYDSNWHNEYGNEGLFVLRFKDVWITAFCGAKPGSCYQFIESVGQTIWLDDEITDLLYFRSQRTPQKNDAVLVVTKRGMEKPHR
jgi:hypothetical protein